MVEIIHMFGLLSGLWGTMIVLSLLVFRVNPMRFKLKIVISIFPLAFISVLLQLLDIVYLIAVIQPLLFIFLLLFIFNKPWLQALLMVIIVYCFSAISEFAVLFILNFFNFNQTIEDLQGRHYLSGWLVVGINFLFCTILYRWRIGFSFFSASSWNRRFNLNPAFAFTLLLAALLTGLISIFLFHPDKRLAAYGGTAMLGAWTILLRKSVQIDNEDG